MILEVTGDQIAQLTDTDLRTLVGYLCEREVRAQGHSPSAVTWGGHQNASDGGVDVRVALSAGAAISGYVPKAATAFQVKAQKMQRGDIHKEMAPDSVVRPSIADLAANGGAYIIVSSKGSHADPTLKTQKAAMAEAVRGLTAASSLTLDFYDRRRIASWVNQHAGLVPWVREKLGLPLWGWRPFEDWSSSPVSVDAP